MNTISVSEAFGGAPPRSAAVVCMTGEGGRTDLQLADWFTWLNIKRNPMISFSLPRIAGMTGRLREGTALVLAFPPLKEAKRYQEAVSADGETAAPKTIPEDSAQVRVPAGSRVLLRCTVAGSYNSPFKKIRIFNCNLEEAMGISDSLLD